MADDPREERVVFFGRELVVFGPGFKGGKGYVSATLSQFADTADIHEVNARDLTGDGAAEIIVRGVRRVTANGQPVELDVLFVYAVRDQTLTRVFGIETGREQAGKRVQGLVQFVPGRTGFEIDVRPGRAIGWTEQTYPWPQEPPGGTVEPLLLPWGGIASLRYAWNGSQFARQ